MRGDRNGGKEAGEGRDGLVAVLQQRNNKGWARHPPATHPLSAEPRAASGFEEELGQKLLLGLVVDAHEVGAEALAVHLRVDKAARDVEKVVLVTDHPVVVKLGAHLVHGEPELWGMGMGAGEGWWWRSWGEGEKWECCQSLLGQTWCKQALTFLRH